MIRKSRFSRSPCLGRIARTAFSAAASLWLVCGCSDDGRSSGEPSVSAGAGGATDPGSGGAVASGGAPSGDSGGSAAGGGGGATASGGQGLPSGGSGETPSGGAPAGGSDGSASGGWASGGSASGGSASGGGGAFTLTSPAFETVPGCSVETPSVCDAFPEENVSYQGGANISPELHISGAPAGTQSFALVLFDVTFGQAHWALWNIPGDATMIAADVPQESAHPSTPAGSQQANANFATTSEAGYFGPHIPCNVFEFELYALSTSTFSPMDPESSVLVSIELSELPDPVLGVARLTGRCNDPMMACE